MHPAARLSTPFLFLELSLTLKKEKKKNSRNHRGKEEMVGERENIEIPVC